MNISYYTERELGTLGFLHFGKQVLVSRKASLYSPELISLGDYVRIDDFCILSGRIQLGSHVHIGAYSALFGSQGIILGHYAGLSARVTIYTTSDDYLGRGMTNPTIPEQFRHVKKGATVLGDHVIVGAGSVILPQVTIGEGSAIGAMSLVTISVAPWKIASGIPARSRADRRKETIKTQQKELEAIENRERRKE